MRLSNILLVFRKEATDLLRDRRTIFGMVVFPLVLFPLITVGFSKFEQRMRSKAQAEPATVMLLGAEHAPGLAEHLEKAEGFRIVPAAADYKRQIGDKKLRAAVELPEGFQKALDAGTAPSGPVQIYYYQGEVRSGAAARKLATEVGKYREGVVEGRLAARNVPVAIMNPIEAKRENVATQEKVSGLKMSILVPYFIIFLCLTGAMHPGMDVTAGEKERGTLETILASAVGRGELVIGKFLLVVLTSLITAAMAITSFALSTKLAGGFSRGGVSLEFQISAKALASLFILVLPLALLFAAAIMAISLFAKSYKEAQSYLSPLMILVIAPAMVGMVPGMDLNPKLALVPILNVSLAAREVLTGNYPIASLSLVMLSTAVLAALALFVTVLMFKREEVLFRA